MWLDVEKGRDTTKAMQHIVSFLLWLDVEKGRDTTTSGCGTADPMLWLDVEKGRDTTVFPSVILHSCCGLM